MLSLTLMLIILGPTIYQLREMLNMTMDGNKFDAAIINAVPLSTIQPEYKMFTQIGKFFN